MAFPRLKTISLIHLQNLKSIYPSPRCFPSLLEIEVSKCPWLRQLPFDLESANFLLKIRGETEWWGSLIWDDEAVKDACREKFVSTPFKGLVKKDHASHIQTESGTFNYGDLPNVVAEAALDSPSSLCLHPAPPPPPRLTAPRPPPRVQSVHMCAPPPLPRVRSVQRCASSPPCPCPAATLCPKVPLHPHPAPHLAARPRPSPAEPPLVMTSESHNDNQLNLEDIDAIKVIGKGNGGVVQLVEHKWTGQLFALKIIQMNIEESARKQIVNILKINKSFQCPYVVVCYQSFCTNGAISIILEYMDGGSLADFLKKVKSISEPYLAAICKQVLKGLMYLHHERHIIHRDLKPSNLLINHRGEVKINDFGVSATLTSSSGRTNTFVGTYDYMSPERIIGGSYDITADIWSLGLVLLECATGKFPYSPPEEAEGWTNIFELMQEIVEPPPPCAPSDQFSPEFCSFISACLQKDPKERKSSHELLALPFLNMYDDMDVDLSSYFTYAGSLIAIDRTQNVIMLGKKSKKERTDKTEQKRAKIN